MSEHFPDFSGKSVIFYISTSFVSPTWLGEGVVLESPVLQTLGSRLFVVGKTPKEEEENLEGDWTANREAFLAWDAVLYYIVLPTDEYEEYRKHAYVED